MKQMLRQASISSERAIQAGCGYSVSASIQDRFSKNRSPMMTGSFMSKDSRMTCFITENLEALIFELTLRRLRMCGKKDLLIYFSIYFSGT